ncbi:hypothetical protein V8C86DRAFT_3020593 [Haematococcus lacustris]
MPRLLKGGATTVLTSSSEDEGVLQEGEGQALDALFQRYTSALSGGSQRDAVFQQGLARVREFLAGSSGDASACLICLSAIKPREAVWACAAGCCALYHLPCIQEWARNQVDQAVLKALSKLTQFPGAAAQARAAAEWGCPKCRQMYSSSAIPSVYTCFCGKVEEPEWDPWRAPHSCGDLCARPLGQQLEAGRGGGGGGCTHTCLLLCHPGPCPPCPLVVDARCYCGARTEKLRCGHHEFSCGQVCSARLDCGHLCPETCHEGPCPPCTLPGHHPCACGARSALLPCCQREWQCGKVCGQRLPCGNHTCERVCHAGPCGGCPHEGVRTCPCGKATYPHLSCADKAPTCGGTCDKLLVCGLHHCQDRCHSGPCSACRATTTRSCHCGKLQREVACGSALQCDRRCTNMRACGRHPCKRRCCDGRSCPPCEESCGRKLRCGHHKCPAPCHSGPCRPCPLTLSFACACGRMASTLPCGAEARALPPRCYGTCPVPRLCRHGAGGAAAPHRCHFGPCPPCTLLCGTLLPCTHLCSSARCHDPDPPAVPPFTPPRPPRVQLLLSDTDELAAAACQVSNRSLKRSRGKAPPTALPGCASAPAGSARRGGRTLPCHQARPWACSSPCGRPLPCGNHTCQLPCHAVEGSSGAAACGACGQTCGRVRPCPHPCPLPCHPGSCPPCLAAASRPCHCGKASLSLTCSTLQQLELSPGRSKANGVAGSAAHTTNTAQGNAQQQQQRAEEKGSVDVLSCGRPCHRQLPHCPHACSVACHAGPCTQASRCDQEVTVRCECKRQRAKWPCARVQQALQERRGACSYDATTPLRLMACGPELVAGSVDGGGARDVRTVPGAVATPGVAAGSRGSKHLTRAERQALADQREAVRRRAEQMQKVKAGATWLAVVLLGLLLAWVVTEVLGWLDRRLRATA